MEEEDGMGTVRFVRVAIRNDEEGAIMEVEVRDDSKDVEAIAKIVVDLFHRLGNSKTDKSREESREVV